MTSCFRSIAALKLVVCILLTFQLNKVHASKFNEKLDKSLDKIQTASTKPEETKGNVETVKMRSEEVAKSLAEIPKMLKEVSNENNKGVAGLDFSAESAEHAVLMAVTGLPMIIDGLQRGDWKTVLHGGLGISASLLFMVGPWGAAASSILHMLNSVFMLMEGGMPEPEESQTEIIDRDVTAAIERVQLHEFKMELQGVKRLYTTLSESIHAFRNPKDKSKTLSNEQAIILYNHAFEELVAFGKLADLIQEKCAVGSGKIKINDAEVMRDVNDCLAFVDLYSELSIMRKLLLLDMSALLTGKFDETADNLVELSRKEYETDMQLLRFFMDPVNFPPSRFVVAVFYQQRHRHPSTDFFLDILAQVFPQKKSKGVLVCTQNALLGQCVEMKPGVKVPDNKGADKGTRKANDMDGYTGRIGSLFIPLGLQVTAVHAKDYRGIEKDGPMIGMTVITTPFLKGFGSLPKDDEKWQSLEIVETDKDSLKYVKVCGLGFMLDRVCISLDEDGEYELEQYKGSWQTKHFGAMTIPAGKKVTLYADDKGEKSVGPLYGPHTIEQLLQPQPDQVIGEIPSWKKIKIEDSSLEEDAETMVTMCTEVNFNGRCFKVEEGDYADATQMSPYKKFINNPKFSEFKKTMKIKSMIIPSHVEVTAFSHTNYNGLVTGPFTGPIHLPDVSEIKSLKISDNSVLYSEADQFSLRRNKFNKTITIGSAKRKQKVHHAPIVSEKSDNSQTVKQWDHQIRDQTFKEFIKDERPNAGGEEGIEEKDNAGGVGESVPAIKMVAPQRVVKKAPLSKTFIKKGFNHNFAGLGNPKKSLVSTNKNARAWN